MHMGGYARSVAAWKTIKACPPNHANSKSLFNGIAVPSKECRERSAEAAVTHIPPDLWATGGLAVVTGKLPLSLPSPRALDPAGLDHSRVYITFSKAYKTPSESLQKCGDN